MPVFKRAVFMAINPRWCYKIFTGEKTLEIRKTMPTKLNPPFDVYVYCTAPAKRSRVNAAITVSNDELYIYPKKGLRYGSSIGLMCCDEEYSRDNFLNGKCIGKFTCDYVQALREPNNGLVDVIDAKMACLTPKEIIEYSNGKILYGWHIKDYELFEHPFTAGDFPTFTRINRPPQSWQYIHIDTETLNERNKYISSEEYEERKNAKNENYT